MSVRPQMVRTAAAAGSEREADLATLAEAVHRPGAATFPEMSDAELERLRDLAGDHRVTGLLARAMASAGHEPPPDVAAAATAATVNHLGSVRVLGRVASALDATAISWAVVKGPILATKWYGDAAARPYHDLDLLVRPKELRAAVEALAGVGFVHRNRNWEGFRRLGVGEIPLDDGSVVLDLHWHLLGLAEHRRMLALPTAELLGRTVPAEIGGTSVGTLDDADTLVHLCVHHAFAGAHHLLHLKDVHLVASGVPTELAVERIQRAGATRLAGVVIDRAERVFGPVGEGPPLAARVCDDRAWLRFNRAVDASWARMTPRRWSPFPGALVGTGRSTRGATARTMVAQAAHNIRPRVGLPNVVSPGGPLDWDLDAGGDPARERYFAEVAAGCYGA